MMNRVKDFLAILLVLLVGAAMLGIIGAIVAFLARHIILAILILWLALTLH